MGGRGANSISALSAGRNLGTSGSGYGSVSAGLKSGALLRDRATGEVVANKNNEPIFYDEVTKSSYRINAVYYSPHNSNVAYADMSVYMKGKWVDMKFGTLKSEEIGTKIRKAGGGKYKIIRP